MSPECSRCKKQVAKLVRMDDSETSAAWSALLEVAWPSYENICVSCALQQLGVDATDFSDEVSGQDESQFLLNLMKGNIAQALVKTILQAFNYDVYPYGYENYLSTVSKSLSTSQSNVSARRIRSTPDLFVYDNKSKDAFLVEVKTTSIKDESKYFIAKAKLDDYDKYWSEAILAIYCLRSGNLYCRRIGDIDRSKLGIKTEFGKRMYELNLEKDFQSLPDVFKSLEADKYSQLYSSIRGVLREFGQT